MKVVLVTLPLLFIFTACTLGGRSASEANQRALSAVVSSLKLRGYILEESENCKYQQSLTLSGYHSYTNLKFRGSVMDTITSVMYILQKDDWEFSTGKWRSPFNSGSQLSSLQTTEIARFGGNSSGFGYVTINIVKDLKMPDYSDICLEVNGD